MDQLAGHARGDRAHGELMRVACQSLAHHQLARRDEAGAQRPKLCSGVADRRGNAGAETICVAPLGQDFQDLQHLQLCFLDEGRCVVAPGLDAAHFKRSVLIGPKVAVGDRRTRVDARGQESKPAVDSFQVDLQPDLIANLLQQGIIIRLLLRARFIDP